jgi:hypothetical protein
MSTPLSIADQLLRLVRLGEIASGVGGMKLDRPAGGILLRCLKKTVRLLHLQPAEASSQS